MFNVLEKSLNRPAMGMRSRDGGGGGGGGGGGMGGACYVYPENLITNPNLVSPDVVYQRGIDMDIPMTMDDGNVVTMWGFTDGGGGMGGGGTFPSPAMRVRQGQIVHTVLDVNMMWAHTIHHHGIEPHYYSDGVGHITWDVQGASYTYQWRPAHAGTYFYHCHTNTVLHAEMGMYGALIVDPPEGIGTLYSGGPTYDTELFWVVDEIDSNWHRLAWDAGTCGGNVGLHSLNPDYFIITGVDGSGSTAMNAAAISGTFQRGTKVLARYICAGYHPQRIRFGGLTGTVHISDGRVLPNAIQATELRAHSGERYDVIFDLDTRGEYIIETDIIHWVSGEVLGTTRSRITVI
ncbi:MAG: multicopper oxidase domain-containing protein [Gammaproteobacteria bacterium]|nr:multicopper oxidase domain-containing protein [Gammaproteobacteria bacterium]